MRGYSCVTAESFMNVLLLGSGGREHALALALSKSPRLGKLIIAPGNPGTAFLGENYPIDIADHRAIIELCRTLAIEFVAIGPEAPLVAGLVDDLNAVGISAFGPTRAAAQLEGSKGFTKDLCRLHGIPTAAYRRFRTVEPALRYLQQKGTPIVIKADGLAGGKGVVVAMTLNEAETAVRTIFAGAFGAAGAELVIEDFLAGEEVSFFALCDGERAVAFASAQDYKRLNEGDQGPNTGGMGAYSPAPIMTPALNDRVMRAIIEPTLRAMAQLGAPFRGMLFAGLMITRDGPQLIEYNVRFGDPECQVMVLRLADDLLSLLIDSATQRLSGAPARLRANAALTVVMAAQGYPEAPRKQTPIRRLAQAAAMPSVTIFHAATRLEDGQLLADGGRVLNISAVGASIEEARERAYAGVDQLDWPGGFCRRDIGASTMPRAPTTANRL
jgi:phosphoribosylamine--glycine ligase